jgi:hypothetical protein
MLKIYPRCKKGLISDYISAHGFYFPCCWIANEPHINEVKEVLGPLYEQLDGKKYSLADIKNSHAMKKIEESWKNEKSVCSVFCSEPIIENRDNTDARNDSIYISFKEIKNDL